ncbi:MAG: MFS transporter [Bacteroidales bacterium]|nr:MFS transporter [Candidatus Latescibacterota bacterium]
MTIEKRKKRMLAAVALHHACNDGSVVTLPAIFPVLFTEQLLIKEYTDIGTIMMFGLVVAIIAQALIGHFAKTRHTRYYLALDALLVGGSLLLLTLSRNYLMMVLFYAGIRLGTSIYHPVGISWVSHSFRGNSLDRAMGIQSAFGNIGVLLAFTSTGFLVDAYGWKVPLYTWGTINLLAVIFGLFMSAGTISSEEIIKEKESEKKSASWPQAFRDIGVFIPMILLGGLAWGIMLNYSPSLLNHRLGMSMSKTGMILGGWMCAGTVSALMYGKIASALTRKWTLITAYIMMTAGSLVLGLAHNVPLIVTAFVLFGLALFATYPSMLSIISVAMDPKNRTTGFALTANIYIIGNSIFAYLSGHISDSFGIQAPFILLGGLTLLVISYTLIIIRKGRLQER